ncbi:sulfotransferase [Lichenicoccus roseus]|uniref:Sulfotransferase n=1 Tax=Lichenicoccus roseus TaxID=2683649 RepID=A0A5R9J9J8_9PROT|nr:sulfotransferase [Lichenicoccus roseus]TLU74284.1 sulfotransferase [Lichenicoccus roseus]
MSVLWCQGMFASGSTWLYNVALAIATDLDGGRPPHGRFVFDLSDTAGLENDAVRHVVKAHQARHGVEAVAVRSDAILVTLRDPRDAVVSMMLYQGFSFYRALLNVRYAAEACMLLAAQRQAVTLHYELGFIDDPQTVGGIARHLGGSLPVQRRDEIFRSTRRPAVEAFIAELERQPTTITDRFGDVFDLASHWHRHHAGRTGEIGRWRRMLYPAQVTGIETELRGWMETFGYAPLQSILPRDGRRTGR